MTYSEKLLSPKWQQKRLEIFNRDGFACSKCKGELRTLHVHHKSYKRGAEPWEYPNDNFETLCDDCHLITEELKDHWHILGIEKRASNDSSITLYMAHCKSKNDGVEGIALYKRDVKVKELIFLVIASEKVISIMATILNTRTNG